MDRRLAALLQEKFGERLLTPVRQRYDESEIRVALKDATDTLRVLHDDPAFRFEMLIDLCGVDTGEEMQVVYHLSSSTSGDWLRVIVPGLDRTAPRIASATFMWPGAEWMEREAYDMFGISFANHPDPTRILMPEDWDGHPLRKDYEVGVIPVQFSADYVQNAPRAEETSAWQ